MRSVLCMTSEQMSDWTEICKVFAAKQNAKLLFVNETSCGLEYDDGSFQHIYIDEMIEFIDGMNALLTKEM